MKGNKIKSKKPQMRKLRNLRDHAAVYYTMIDWETKEIEGVVFMPVVKMPTMDQKMVHWMRKDSMEYVK